MIKQTFLTVFVLLACFLALMEGLPSMPRARDRCFCKGLRNSVNRNLITKTEYYRPSSTCSQEELIVTLRKGQRFCVNLNGEQGRQMKQNLMNNHQTK
ncbi:C-X-C motif chemokine 11-6-like [Ahaetulla prasina]|uniref:C-X-C motif chemokine 11-6-like n=1 Tax=Ahaetulla prasina TaxID=499056 RepID=UPI00264A1969|nr:C-X-C motif chemokine 11-6-like [Ahaetulla prasina]